MFKRPLQFLILFVTLGSLLACRSATENDVEAGPIKIGVVYPFTGPNPSTGQDLRDGVELAKEIINAAFDLPIPMAPAKGYSWRNGAGVQVIYKDSQGDPQIAADKVEELVKSDGVAAVMGCYSSTVTAAASERAEMLQVPFLNATSTSPILTRRGFRWFFRTTPDDEMFAENFFAFLADLAGGAETDFPKRLTLVYENRLWGTGVAQAEKKMAVRYGYEVVGDVPYDSKADRFEEELKQVKSSLPAIIMQASYAQDAVRFMKGYKSLRINPIATLAMNGGFISPSFLETLGADAEFILSREVWALDIGDRKPLVESINRLFRERSSRDMTGNSARAFTGLLVLAEAINRAESPEPTRVREALLEAKIPSDQLIMPWDGVAFDPKTGQNTLGKGIIVQVQEGRYNTVWPAELSTRSVRWPMPRWSERTAR